MSKDAEFLQTIWHDIQTPVTGIINCANLIKNSTSDISKVKEYADLLIESGYELLSFLTDTFETADRKPLVFPSRQIEFDLRALLEKILTLNQTVACHKHLCMHLDYDPSLPHSIISDPNRLYCIILELITNALKYTHTGTITLRAKLISNSQQQGNSNTAVVQIIIEDTGIGIPLHCQPDIFTPHKRFATATQQTRDSGVGLGLSFVKKSLQLLGADIDVFSEVDKGSQFICTIPFETAQATTISPNEHTRGRILLVEDHPIVAKINQAIIADLNYQVDTANQGSSALALIETHVYDLVLMDIKLGDITGDELSKHIRASVKNASVPIIGLTAHFSIQEKMRCLLAGINILLPKPLMKDRLINIFDLFLSTCPPKL